MEWTALSFDENPRTLLHGSAFPWDAGARGPRLAGPRRCLRVSVGGNLVWAEPTLGGSRARKWFSFFPANLLTFIQLSFQAEL